MGAVVLTASQVVHVKFAVHVAAVLPRPVGGCCWHNVVPAEPGQQAMAPFPGFGMQGSA